MSDGFALTVPPDLLERLADAIADRLQVQAEPQGSPWLTVDEAAEHLRWPKQRVYKLTAAHAIPCRRHENRLLFHRDELDDWLEDFRDGPTPTP